LISFEKQEPITRKEYNLILKTHEQMQEKCTNSDGEIALHNAEFRMMIANKELEETFAEIDWMLASLKIWNLFKNVGKMMITKFQQIKKDHPWRESTRIIFFKIYKQWDKTKDPMYLEHLGCFDLRFIFAERYRDTQAGRAIELSIHNALIFHWVELMKCNFKMELSIFGLYYGNHCHKDFEDLQWAPFFKSNDWMYSQFLFHVFRNMHSYNLFLAKLTGRKWVKPEALGVLVRTLMMQGYEYMRMEPHTFFDYISDIELIAKQYPHNLDGFEDALLVVCYPSFPGYMHIKGDLLAYLVDN
jgi:hypothetical protein